MATAEASALSMGLQPCFADVEDTPMFKQTVDDLQLHAKKLRERVAGLLAGAKRYRDGVNTLAEAQAAFAATLSEFGGGADEDSLDLGSALLGQFITAFRELGGFIDILRTSLDTSLVEALATEWLDGRLAALRDEQRRHERRAADVEAARMKHVALKKLTKRDVLERSLGELASARGAADEARFELARRLNEVESCKRYSFLELVVGVMHGHLLFFAHGAETLRRLEAPMGDVLGIVEHLKRQQGARERALDDMIARYQERMAAHDVNVMRQERPPDAPDGGAGHAVGPVQLSPLALQAAELSNIERLISTTQACGGAQVSILRQGYLWKKSGSKSRHDWKRRFFVLDSNGMLYYYSLKADTLMSMGRGPSRPKNTLPLLTSTIKMDAEEPGVRCAFRVVSPEGVYSLQAENELERGEWVGSLQAVISVLLNGGASMASLPRVPVRPTHSRHNSYSEVATLVAGDALLAGGGGGAAAAAVASGAAVGAGGSGGSQPGTPFSGLSTISSQDAVSSDGDSPRLVSGVHASTSGAAGRADSGHHHHGQHGSHHHTPHRLQHVNHAHSSSPGQRGGADAAVLAYQQQQRGHHSASGGGGLAGGGGSGPGPLERLRRVSGNGSCCDCGAPDPDWASLNLGVLLCIDCSGAHRQLGVHISKVRSTTLDVKVWEPSILELFGAVGNNYANSVWEERLAQQAAAAAALSKGDAWVWCDDDSSDDGGSGGGLVVAGRRRSTSSSGARRSGGGGSGRGSGAGGGKRQLLVEQDTLTVATAPPAAKPGPGAPLADKTRFVVDKYSGRAFVAGLPREAAQARLWDAVASGSIRGALAALAAGGDINAAYRTPRAQRLVAETHARAAALAAAAAGENGGGGGGGGGSEDGDLAGACGGVGVLHCAAAGGAAPPLLEFLLLNGAAVAATDAYGRTPLHYAILYDSVAAAKLLLRRGGSNHLAAAKDARGNTAMDVAMSKGRVSDEELFLLLSTM